MHRLTLLLCSLILATGLVPAFAQPAVEAQKKLQGTWTATKAERDGSAAADVVGHRLSVTGNRFQIQSQDGQVISQSPSPGQRVRPGSTVTITVGRYVPATTTTTTEDCSPLPICLP